MSSNSRKDSKKRNLRDGERQMKDGRYQYRYVDKRGERRSVYSWKLVPTDKVPKGKKDDLSLREKERNIQRDLNDGIDIASAQMTTTQLLERYFATKKSLQNSTYENYQNLFKKHIKDTVVGQTSIGKVHKSDIILLYDDIHENGNIAISTLKIIQSFMYPAFQLAVEDNIIRVNPCMGCMHHFIDNAESERIALTKEQEEGLLHYVKKSRYYNYLYPMFVFMLETGCRIGETTGITWDDIDFEKRKIRVNHQLQYRKKKDTGKYAFYITDPKNKKPRDIPMSKFLYNVMLAYKAETYFTSCFNTYQVDGYKKFVFLNRKLKVYKQETINRAIHTLIDSYNKSIAQKYEGDELDEMKLPQFSSHDLRHTFATKMVEKGINVKVLQMIMGHTSLAITLQVYTHLKYKAIEKEMARMEAKSYSEEDRVEKQKLMELQLQEDIEQVFTYLQAQ